MSTLTLRSTKGSPLTNAEVDANFSNLNSDKLQIGSSSTSSAANQIPYFNASNQLALSSAFVFNGTSLGVGVNPGVRLDVGGSVRSIVTTGEAQLMLANTTRQVYWFNSYAGNTYGLFDGTAAQHRLYYDAVSNYWALHTGASERMRVDSNGNLCVGTSTAQARLTVAGDYSAGTGNFAGGVTAFRINGTGSYSEPRIDLGEGSMSPTAYIASKNTANGGGSLIFGNRDTSSLTSTLYERMRISPTGDVLIGSAADAGNTLRYLDVYNTNIGNSAGSIIRLVTNNSANTGTTTVDFVKYRNGLFVLNNNDTSGILAINNAGSERMRIDASGNVGIGTTAPNGVFHAMANVPNGTATFYIDNRRTYTAGNYGKARLALSLSEGISDTSASSRIMGYIEAGNAVDTTSAEGYLAFGTRTGSSNYERMRINADGTAKFMGASGSITNSVQLTYDGISGGANFGPNSSGGGTYLTFGTSNAGSYGERMRIDSSGNVGIGTSSPGAKLHVQGSGYFSGTLQTASTFYTSGTQISSNSSSNPLTFGINDAEKMRIDTSGYIHVGGVSSDSNRGLVNVVAAQGRACGFSFSDNTSGPRGSLWWSTTTGSVGISLFNNDNSNMMFGTTGVERMRINTSGYVTTPYQPSFRARGSGGSYSQAAGKMTIFTSVTNDVGSNYSAANSRFTAPVSGWYYFFANVFGVGGSDRIGLMINGAGQSAPYLVHVLDGVQSGSIIVYLSANDYVELFAQYGTSNPYQDHCGWGGRLLG